MLCVSVSELELFAKLSVDGHGDSALVPWEDSSSLLSTPLLLVDVELR